MMQNDEKTMDVMFVVNRTIGLDSENSPLCQSCVEEFRCVVPLRLKVC